MKIFILVCMSESVCVSEYVIILVSQRGNVCVAYRTSTTTCDVWTCDVNKYVAKQPLKEPTELKNACSTSYETHVFISSWLLTL